MENKNANPILRFIHLLKLNKQDVMSVYLYAAVAGIVSLSLPLGIQAIMNFITAAQISTSWIVLVILVVAGIVLAGFLQILLQRCKRKYLLNFHLSLYLNKKKVRDILQEQFFSLIYLLFERL